MKIIKSKKMQETLLNVVLVVGGLFLVAALLHYGNNKSTHKDMMVSGGDPQPSRPSMPLQPPAQQNKVNVVSPQRVSGNSGVQASTDDIFDQTFGQVGAVASSLTGGSVQKQVVTNPNELLPKQQNSNSALMNPPRNDLAGKNFLTAENQVGINTVGNSLRNANQQLRSDPQIPMNNNVGPWLNSTIEPDNMRRPLEIGGNCN
jgi:hypothetical protein